MPNEMVERVAKAIALRFAPAIDFKAPYAKIMLDSAAKDIMKILEDDEALMAIINRK